MLQRSDRSCEVSKITWCSGARGQASKSARSPDVAAVKRVGPGFFNTWLERRKSGPQIAASEPQGSGTESIGLRETLALAGALSINNIGLGFAGGVAGLEYGSVALSVAGFSMTLLWLGEWLRRKLVRPMAAFDWLRLDGHLLLVGVGIAIMVGV